MSTIGVEATERTADLVTRERHDAFFVDAPVSGRRVAAERGTLLIFASGPEEARPRVTPVFDVLSQRTLWLGPAGNGSRMKLVNNVLLAFTAEGVANAMALAVAARPRPRIPRLGVGRQSVGVDVGDGEIPSLGQERVLGRVRLSLALKDVRLALSESGPGRFEVLAALADEWQAVVDQGLGDQDLTVMTRTLAG